MTQYAYKITLIGDVAVGKTSLRRSFMGESFIANHISTIGADFSVQQVSLDDGDQVEFQIWDLAGQKNFDNIRSQFFSGTKGSLVVFDLTSRESFGNLSNWIDLLFKNNRSGPVPLLIVGNKLDLQEDILITDKEISGYVDQLNATYEFNINYFKTSAKTGENVEDAFLSFAEQLKNYYTQ